MYTDMERDVPNTTGPASPPDPVQDQPGIAMPEHIAFILHAVGILLGYGRHLLATVQHRATAPTFTTIAACFGTANLSTIIAHLNRGILRAAALERVLLARAATGRDITIPTPRIRTDEAQAAPASAQAEPPAAPFVTPKAERRPFRPTGRDDPEFFMPTPEELERQVRRRPLGRTMVDICLDLGVVPGFCTAAFWNQIFEIIQCLGGSLGTLMRERTRRGDAFARKPESSPESNWDWRDLGRDAIRQVLGFFIGEPPVDPSAPSPATCAVATGPP
jgi:hypothetical protein